jgi:hypothetical protein
MIQVNFGFNDRERACRRTSSEVGNSLETMHLTPREENLSSQALDRCPIKKTFRPFSFAEDATSSCLERCPVPIDPEPLAIMKTEISTASSI